jgi:hypothetical protein
MATPICQLCGENPAQQMMTNLETGESLAICADDFPSFVLGLAEKMMEAGQIELPEVAGEQPAASADGVLGDSGVLSEASETSQEAPGGPTTAEATSGPANVKRTPARPRGTSGRSPGKSTAAATATVDPETADEAEEPAGVAVN